MLNETNALSFILVNLIFLIGTFTFAVVLGVVSDDITTEVKVMSGSLECAAADVLKSSATQPCTHAEMWAPVPICTVILRLCVC